MQFFVDVKTKNYTGSAQHVQDGAADSVALKAAFGENQGSSDTIGSIFVLQTQPMAGLWSGQKRNSFQLGYSWHLDEGKVGWEPFVPKNEQQWADKIYHLVKQADGRRTTGAFLRLSKTSQTNSTWSLPAIAACPIRDETCESCYALRGWYRLDIARQIDRVLRLEYLRRLIGTGRIWVWVDWMVNKLNALPPEESFPAGLHPAGTFNAGSISRYFRWHDSGDLFHMEYARAIFQVSEATPRVAHWLPTRMGGLVRALVQQGITVPSNLSIQLSVQKGGRLEPVQRQAAHDILQVQRSARVGLSYFIVGPRSRQADADLAQRQFGRGAVVCQAVTAEEPKDRVCEGCRRCWAANMQAPIIYPRI